MYLYDKNRITYFAETDRRNKRVPFGIKADDRTRHMYIIGKTGMGKSTLIENLVAQDIKNGEGFAFIDPHGKSAALLLDYIPPERVKDVVYFAPFDIDNPISFNVMEDVGADKRHLIANGLLSAFKKIWGPETFSARMEYILMNALLALLEYPDSTLLGVNRMLTDKAYRKKVVDNVKDPSVKAYWVDEFAKYTEKFAAEATPAIQNKLGQFTSNPLIRNIIGQPHSSFDLRRMMDERKILIVNLSKGQLGEGNAALLGGMIITKIYLAAMSRADLTEEELKRLPNFYMYVDEFQSFANESFADILSEARKYKLALTVAHQYIKQMDEKVADAVFGNVGTQIMFRVGAPDAEVLEKEYAPVFTAEDMVSLGKYQLYLKLMIDGVASHPFSAVTLPPIAPPAKSLREQVIKSSRELYGHPRAEVEKSIADWFTEGTTPPTPKPSTASPESAGEGAAGSRTEYPPRTAYKAPTSSPQGAASSQKAPYQAAPSSTKTVSNGAAQARPAVFDRGAYEEKTRQPQRVDQYSEGTGDRTRIAPAPTPSREQPRAPKLEKPFANAFKGIVIPEPIKKEEPKAISLSELTQNRPANGGVSPKNKTAPAQGLSELKAALASVIKEKPFQGENEKGTTSFNKQQSVPAAPHVSDQKTAPSQQQPSRQDEQRGGEASSAGAVRERDLNKKSNEHQNSHEQIAKDQPREVPEDVLTAILRGDD